jgi:uncharacterized protein YjbJ (UPF0337 family)
VNKDIISGKWTQMKGEIQRQWGKFTDDDLETIKGDKNKIIGLLQERYGYAQDQAHKHLDEFEKARSK